MGSKIKAGDNAISAREFNRHVDAADFLQSNFGLGIPGAPKSVGRGANFVAVKNSSGGLRRQGELLEFTGLDLTDLTSRELMLVGGSPSLANAFGILQAPIASGERSELCQVAGTCVALVNMASASHKFARVTSATYVLQSVALGPVRILFSPGGTGEKTCAVLIPQAPDQSFICKPNADYSMGENNATLNLYDKYSGSSLSVSLTGGIILTRDVLTTDWMSGTIINGVPHAAPIDCE